jgi:hypothetical protein
MSSVCYGGKIRMQVVEEDEKLINDDYFDLDKYPLTVPQVYLEGRGEEYFPQTLFSWDDDSVVVVRNGCMVEYTRTSYIELLAENENGEIVWMDGRTAPYEGCWGGKYLDEYRGACTYTVQEYDFATLEKRKYKVVQEDVSKFDRYDVLRLMEFMGEEKFCSKFVIENGVLRNKQSSEQISVAPTWQNTN